MDLLDKRIRDCTEMIVHEAWSESLGRDDFCTDENFFMIGGMSRAALGVIVQIRERLGVEMPLQAMWEFPTVASMAQYLREGGDLPIKSYMPIRPGLDPTLALVHPLGGSIIWFCDLIARLPATISVAGLQALALDPRGVPHEELDLMAKAYLDELLELHKPGNLILVGLSFGGLVAYEMACQLHRLGAMPADVVLLDTVIPSHEEAQPAESELLAKLVQSALNLQLDIERLSTLSEERVCDEILKESYAAGALPRGYGRERMRRLMQVYGINAAAALRYKLPSYPGPLHLIKSMETERETWSDGTWRDRCDHLTVHQLGVGSHSALISGDNATPVADYIQHLWMSRNKKAHSKGGVSKNGLQR